MQIFIIITILLINMIFSTISEGKQLHLIHDKKLAKKEVNFLQHYNDLDKYYSNKILGAFYENGKTFFRLFAPQALDVNLYLFSKVDDIKGKSYNMTKDSNGVWEYVFNNELEKVFYGFKVKKKKTDSFEKIPLSIDPYAKALASYTTYMNPRKSILMKHEYDWEGDSWIQRDWRDLVIYEMHIRDITVHPTSGIEEYGTYKGLTEKGKRGGIDYIKNLGVNTVELLPPMDFGRIEIPYRDSMAGRYNTWNPYERNHWGYMTAGFFAPEPYYSIKTKELEWNKWIGADGRHVSEFKDMVKAFHKEGIAVIMDVVYNHLSEYETGNLKEIDHEYYFRLNSKGEFIAESGCGNDLKTERPMVRRMIIESIIYWMKEYHIDGFRFDLGKLIDWVTLEEIIKEARKINPYVIFVCEPWGGGYDPAGFSLRGWGSWNDQIRNGIKGENPFNGLGWIFGHWYGNNNIDRIKSYVNGTLTKDKYGLFLKKEHSVNYLESHDGYTLGDFIRLGTHYAKRNQKVTDYGDPASKIEIFQKLNQEQLKLNKLAALFLITSQGIVMIHSGQEYARTKIIPNNPKIKDHHKGQIDHNSYEKDNEVNYINYNHADANSELLDYYKGLIQLRKSFDAFRYASYDEIKFLNITDNDFALGYNLKYEMDEFLVLFNANREKNQEILLPAGNWQVIVSPSEVTLENSPVINNSIMLNQTEGYVLKKIK